jgi:glucose-1-phosphate thymidylyltransferase
MLKNGINISAIMTEQPWLDVVYPWDMIGLNAVILRNISHNQSGTIEPGVCLRGQVSIGKGTIIRANSYIIGPIVIGEGCDIGPNACIFPATSIGNNITVSPFTRIKNSIIGDGVHIGSGCDIEDSIIDRNCMIGGHFYASAEETKMQVDWQIYMVKVGAMIGEGCEINNGVIAQPGLIAGNYCRIKSLKTINGTFADGSIVA